MFVRVHVSARICVECVCVGVCVCGYGYVCVCGYGYVCVCGYGYVCVCVGMFVCVHICICDAYECTWLML